MKIFNQRDDRWKDKKLGFSDVTLGGYGCLVSCLAMIATRYGKDTDPDKMNEDLKDVDGFMGGYYKWKSLTKIYSDIYYTDFVRTPNPVTNSQFEEIDRHLESGHIAIIEVDFQPNTAVVENHFVVLTSKSNNGYNIADPWTGTMRRLAEYGTHKYAIQRYVLYEGPLQENDDDDDGGDDNNNNNFLKDDISTETEEQFDLKEQDWYDNHWTGKEFIEAIIEIINVLDDETNRLENKIGEYQETIEILRKEREELIDERTELIEEIDRMKIDYKRELKTRDKAIDKLSKRNEDLLKENKELLKDNTKIIRINEDLKKDKESLEKRIKMLEYVEDSNTYKVGKFILSLINKLKGGGRS